MNKDNRYSINDLASIIHDVNRRLQIINGDTPEDVSPLWEDAPEWQREASRESVRDILRGQTPEQLWQSWAAAQIRDGWTYGPVKDVAAKIHPCLVRKYQDLPAREQDKDLLRIVIVKALTP